MTSNAVIDRVRRLDRLRHGVQSGTTHAVGDLEAGLGDIAKLRSWISATEATIIQELEEATPFPEASIADRNRCSIGAAGRSRERADTLADAAAFAAALSDGTITTGHVDELTRAGKRLESASQRDELLDREQTLLAAAEGCTIEQFRTKLTREINSIQRDDGRSRLERQRRATTLSTWIDDEGLWNLRGRFDPLTGVRLSRRLDDALEALFAEATPPTCPGDPVEKQKHLRALALARLLEQQGGATGVRSGKPEFVAVIDIDQDNGNGEPSVDWGLAVELPMSVLADLADAEPWGSRSPVAGVVVRNGVVLHAPGELDLGRAARHANRAQRRALRGLYRTCAVPGCRVHFERCKLHHITWWSHGGATDLHNLLPVCSVHHHRIHDAGWSVSLGEHRELTVRLPDGTVMSTGPPSRSAA